MPMLLKFSVLKREPPFAGDRAAGKTAFCRCRPGFAWKGLRCVMPQPRMILAKMTASFGGTSLPARSPRKSVGYERAVADEFERKLERTATRRCRCGGGSSGRANSSTR